MGKAEWYFPFVYCLDEASCTGGYWLLGDAGSCIQEVSFAWVLTIWYFLGLAPWMGEPGGLPSLGSHGRTRLKRLSSSSSRVSSLVVHGLGVSASTLKAQGLILCWRLKVWDRGAWRGQVKTLFQATDSSLDPPLSEARSWRDTPVSAADRLLGRMWRQSLLLLFFFNSSFIF